MRWGIAGIAGLMLAGCDAAGDAEPAPEAVHSVDPATGELHMVIPHEDGPATLRSGPTLPVRLPDGLTLPEGATVTANSRFEQAGGSGALVTFETLAPAAAVITHFRDQAEAAGFAITLDRALATSHLLLGERARDGAKLSVTATSGPPTSGQILVSG
ncbi:hypothetical protein ACLBKU_15210 [Erythrobacter sp. NE805]|uniref:hypothetical protein n=1 Tax=Erythrobacter sp. NE805 TaxID=3389875 RepID=UPI00396AF22C